MVKISTPNGPEKSNRPTRKKKASNPLIMVAALASSVIASVVVGLLIINSSAFKSFRANLSETETKKESASTGPVDFDPNYDYSKDKEGSDKGKAEKPNTNERVIQPKPATPKWNESAAQRDIPLALTKPRSELDVVSQPIKLAISQRNYDHAMELYQAASRDSESPSAFSDMENRLKTLEQFWSSVRKGLVRCIPGTEIKRSGEWLECVSKSQDFVTLRQSSGAEKAFKTDYAHMDTDLAIALQRSVTPSDEDSGKLFAELDFVGNRDLLALGVELQKADSQRQVASAAPETVEPKKVKKKPKRDKKQENETLPERIPIPDKQQLAAKSKLIRELFKEQYSDRSDQGRAALIQLLIKQGNDTNDDDAGRFALYQEALDLAQKVGDAQSAWTAVSLMTANYEMDTFEAKVSVLREVSKKFNDEAAFAEFVTDCQTLIQADIELDRYDVAIDRARKLLAVARKGASSNVGDSLSELSRRIKTLRAGFARIESHLTTLESQPNNEQANQAVGEFYCLVKSSFDVGLPHLAKGSEKPLRELASEELALKNPPSATRLEIADRWWDLAENKRWQGFRPLATSHYLEVVDGLSGLAKTKVEKRLSVATREASDDSLASQLQNFVWRVQWGNGVVFEKVLVANDSCQILTGKGNEYVLDYRDAGDFVELWSDAKKRFYRVSIDNRSGALLFEKFSSRDGGKVVLVGLGQKVSN